MRQDLISSIGKGRKLDGILSKLRKEMTKLKSQLKHKYKTKLNHLELQRQKDLEARRQ